jgi:hypothetical protein
MTRCPFRINAVPPLNAMTDLGANNCHGDGATDDSAHLAAGMDAAVAAGKRLYVPAGTYRLTSHVDIPAALYMYGDGATTIFAPEASYCFHLENAANGVTLHNFKIDGNYVGSEMGIASDDSEATATTLTLSNLTIQDMHYAAVYFGEYANVSGLTVSNCIFTHCGDFSIVHSRNSTSSGGTITNVVASGFEGLHSPPHGFYFHEFDNLTLTNCECYDCDKDQLIVIGQGVGGFEFDNCLAVVLNTCNSHDNIVAGDTQNGYGFIGVEATTITYNSCVGSNNRYDFYECYMTGGSATYTGSTTFPPYTKQVAS